MRIALIAKPGNADSGVGRYTLSLAEAMRREGHEVVLVAPSVPLPYALVRLLRRWPGWDIEAFFHNYALRAHYPSADIYHITSQNLATLMALCPPPGLTVITVHDIIPWLVRNDPELRSYPRRWHELFDRVAMWGLRRADHLIVDSSFSANSLAAALGRRLPAKSVVLLGYD